MEFFENELICLRRAIHYLTLQKPQFPVTARYPKHMKVLYAFSWYGVRFLGDFQLYITLLSHIRVVRKKKAITF